MTLNEYRKLYLPDDVTINTSVLTQPIRRTPKPDAVLLISQAIFAAYSEEYYAFKPKAGDRRLFTVPMEDASMTTSFAEALSDVFGHEVKVVATVCYGPLAYVMHDPGREKPMMAFVSEEPR